ncbi:MAG: KEOPS complex subunit Pcc1 [Candidatus Norongarragalinales archaeon]
MKAEVEIIFASPAHAKKAVGIIKTKEFSDKASVRLSAKGATLTARVDAKTFSALRARTTSLLRDLKVVFDAISLVPKKR